MPLGKEPITVCPQVQVRAKTWCSIKTGLMGGISTTCRRSTISEGKWRMSRPQWLQYKGLCAIITSGAEVISKVLPSWPGCPPGFLPLTSRRLLLWNGRFSSFYGGIELLLLFLGFSYLASRSDSDLLIAINSITINWTSLSWLSSSLIRLSLSIVLGIMQTKKNNVCVQSKKNQIIIWTATNINVDNHPIWKNAK